MAKTGRDDPSRVRRARRKRYVEPRLVLYGSVLKLTQGTGTKSGEAGNMMPCL